MILVDSSVWIDSWNDDTGSCAQTLKKLIEDDQAVINGLIYTEITQGARNEKEFSTLEKLLRVIPILQFAEHHWLKSAKLFFDLKKKGLTVTTVDCVIAQMALETNSEIFSNDKIFRKMSPHCGLKIFSRT